MKLEVLMSCMHQTDDKLVRASAFTGDVVVINQCDRNGYDEYKTENGVARMFSTTQRGLTKSRNMAIENAVADVCLVCDDDEVFVKDYEKRILKAYKNLPDADIIIFKMAERKPSFEDRIMRLKFPQTMKVSSWQISFRRESILKSGVRFDELMGAGSGNGAEEELKFLLDSEKAGLKIYYVPYEIATVAQNESTWFKGFTEEFFENRGATTRYVLGTPLALLYAVSYVVRKKDIYKDDTTPVRALMATLKGIAKNKIGKQKAEMNK